MIVGTSDTRSELPTSYIFAGREGFVGNYTGPPIEGSELPTRCFPAGRWPVVGRTETLLLGVGTSDLGSEHLTPTDFSRFSAHVCIVLRVGLLASILDTLASPNHGFASLLIVRCFLYSNLK